MEARRLNDKVFLCYDRTNRRRILVGVTPIRGELTPFSRTRNAIRVDSSVRVEDHFIEICPVTYQEGIELLNAGEKVFLQLLAKRVSSEDMKRELKLAMAKPK